MAVTRNAASHQVEIPETTHTHVAVSTSDIRRTHTVSRLVVTHASVGALARSTVGKSVEPDFTSRAMHTDDVVMATTAARVCVAG